jgi:L-rhamnose mutarotase
MRRAFVIRLQAGALPEYDDRHKSIWPEVVAEIERCGISRITAFESDPLVFYYSEVADERAWEKLWSSEIHAQWAEAFAPLIARAAENEPVRMLRELYHLETALGAG